MSLRSVVTRRVSDRRLLKLAAFLKRLPKKRFNYSHWVGEDWKGAQDLSCGTTACALGWAASMPEFRRLGLHLKRVYGRPEVGLKGSRRASPIDAAAQVFGLSDDEALFLFVPGEDLNGRAFAPYSKATPQDVARHIAKFVKSRDAYKEG